MSSTSNNNDNNDVKNLPETAAVVPAVVRPTLPDDFPYVPIGHPDTMMSIESVRKAIEEFQTRPTDIIVATFSKTGTTLVSWICHQLRTGGHLDFDTLYEVIPWPLLSWDIGYDPNLQGNQFTPRVFKSHLRMASIYRGCKYIVTIRDPCKTAISFYVFLKEAKAVPALANTTLLEFTKDLPFLKGYDDDGTGNGNSRASIWQFYKEYHMLKDCPNVLILVYEDLVQDMETNIKRIAKFMNINKAANGLHGDTLIKKVLEMSTKEYMSKYNTKFDEPYERAKNLGRVGDLSQLAPGAKVAATKHKHIMPKEGVEFLNTKWNEIMKPLGYNNYEEFATTIRQINKERYD